MHVKFHRGVPSSRNINLVEIWDMKSRVLQQLGIGEWQSRKPHPHILVWVVKHRPGRMWAWSSWCRQVDNGVKLLEELKGSFDYERFRDSKKPGNMCKYHSYRLPNSGDRKRRGLTYIAYPWFHVWQYRCDSDTFQFKLTTHSGWRPFIRTMLRTARRGEMIYVKLDSKQVWTRHYHTGINITLLIIVIATEGCMMSTSLSVSWDFSIRLLDDSTFALHICFA